MMFCQLSWQRCAWSDMSALYSARDELSALGQQCEISNESLQSRDFFFFQNDKWLQGHTYVTMYSD